MEQWGGHLGGGQHGAGPLIPPATSRAAQLCSRLARLSRARAAISSGSHRSSRAAETGAAVVITLVRLWDRHHLNRSSGTRPTSRAIAQKNT